LINAITIDIEFLNRYSALIENRQQKIPAPTHKCNNKGANQFDRISQKKQ
jgi:hypothetical protein